MITDTLEWTGNCPPLLQTLGQLLYFTSQEGPNFCTFVQSCLKEIYDVPMKFVHKLIHGGSVHPCYEPFMNYEPFKGRALHWPN